MLEGNNMRRKAGDVGFRDFWRSVFYSPEGDLVSQRKLELDTAGVTNEDSPSMG